MLSCVPMNPTKSVQAVLTSLEAASRHANRPIQLVAVSKYVKTEALYPLIASGITDFGENRIQDALPKIQALKEDHPHLTWHLIGHLQKNKVKKAVAHFDWIQSIDSIALLEKINQVASESGKTLQGLIQVNIGEESQKHGFSVDTFMSESDRFFNYESIQIRGLMAILPNCDTREETAKYFEKMNTLYESFAAAHPGVDTLSMGMSGDYELAIEKGATMVRVGSKLFVV